MQRQAGETARWPARQNLRKMGAKEFKGGFQRHTKHTHTHTGTGTFRASTLRNVGRVLILSPDTHESGGSVTMCLEPPGAGGVSWCGGTGHL